MTQRIQELNQLKDSVAGMNKNAAAQEKATLGMSLQKTIQQAPGGPGSAVTQAQSIAPQAATAASQIDLKAQQKTQQQQGKLSEEQLRVETFNLAQDVKKRQLKLQKEVYLKELQSGRVVTNEELAARSRITKGDIDSKKRIQSQGMAYDNSIQFATWQARDSFQRISIDAKSRFFDQRLAFRKKDGKRKLSNEQQLYDFAMADARSAQDFENKAQIIEQVSDTKIAALETASRAIEQKMRLQARDTEREKDQKAAKDLNLLLEGLKETHRREMARKRSRAAKKAQGGAFVGSVMGGVAGAIIGGPAGAAAGAQAGGAIGASISLST